MSLPFNKAGVLLSKLVQSSVPETFVVFYQIEWLVDMFGKEVFLNGNKTNNNLSDYFLVLTSIL